jgi:CrcB protein
MLGTTIANVLGCAAIGALAEIIVLGHVSPRTQLAVQTGFLGGLTTFSSFALESAVLADTGRYALAGMYVLANLFLGWAALLSAAVVARGWMA